MSSPFQKSFSSKSPFYQEKESSYQPIKDKKGKVILTSKQAEAIDEDNHEFDHKPSKSEIDKAAFINAKMKKMRKKSQGRKAVKNVTKAVNNIKKNN